MVLKQQGRLEEAARLWASGNALSQFVNVTVFEREIGDLPEIDGSARELTLEEALALVQKDPG